MKILDRYIARELRGPFIFGMVLFITLIVSGEYLFKLTRYLAFGSPFMPVAELFGLKVVSVTIICMPMAMLLATLVAFGRLSNDSELIAMQASGVPVWRISYASVFYGLILSVSAYCINEFIVPPAGRASRRIEDGIQASIKNNIAKTIGAGKVFFVQDFEDGQLARAVLARGFDPVAGRMTDVTFLQYSEGRLKAVVEAKQAEWVEKASWRFRDARMTIIGGVKGNYAYVETPETTLTLNKSPEEIQRDLKDPDELSSAELDAYIKQQQEAKAPRPWLQRLYVARANKLSMPFASLVFAVLGTPLGIRRHRSGAAVGVGMSLLILFAYYVLWHGASILGENGVLPVVVSAWAANVICLIVGIGLTIRASR
jgi:lipopolysaccharide export system permease protein